ncbi:MAG: hypothetical protein Q9167_001066 [Letrouitia subvulpina]
MADAEKDPFPGLLLSSTSSEDEKENNTPYMKSEAEREETISNPESSGRNHHRNGQPLSELLNHKAPFKQTRFALPPLSFSSKPQNLKDRNDVFVVRKRVRFSSTPIHGKARSYAPSMAVRSVRFAQDLSPGQASSSSPSNLKDLKQIASPPKKSILMRHSGQSKPGELLAMHATDDSPQPISMPPQDEPKQHSSGRTSRFSWLDSGLFIDETYPPKPEYRFNHRETTRLIPLYDLTSDVGSNESFIAYFERDQTPQDKVATLGMVIPQVKKELPLRSCTDQKTQTDLIRSKNTIHPTTHRYPPPVFVIRSKIKPSKPNRLRPVFVFRNKPKTDANAEFPGFGSVPLKDLKPLRQSRV